MASTVNVLICAALAVVLWGFMGLALATRVAPRTLAWWLAPASGWAVHSALPLPIFSIIGMSRTAVAAVMIICVIAALAALWTGRQERPELPSVLAVGALATAVLPALVWPRSCRRFSVAASLWRRRFSTTPKSRWSERRRDEIDDQFIRIFAANGAAADIVQLATQYDCGVVVLTAQDGAWTRDPLPTDRSYRLVESDPAVWRIYKSVNARDPARA